jgi:ADP-ribosylglycohydrolase
MKISSKETFMISFQKRVRGAIFGAALGDALGAPVEKLSHEQIKEKYGRVESLRTEWYKANSPEINLGRKRGNGIVTDDTLMMRALINVYLKEKRHLDAYDMGKEFIKEIAFRKTYIPEFDKEGLVIDRLFYPEKHIFLRHVLANCEPREGGHGNMVNCGAAMYCTPIGIVNAGNPKAAYDEAILFAIGHQVSYGLEAAGVFAACVAKAFEPGAGAADIVETALLYAKDGTQKAICDLTDAAFELRSKEAGMDEVIRTLHEKIAPYSPMGDDVHRKMEKAGLASNHYTPSRLFSIEELPMALAFIVLNDGSFYPSVYDGINSGRDTDSIGVMAGAILGAMHGEVVLAEQDIELLEETNKMDLMGLADEFAILAQELIREDILLNEKRQKLLQQ